MRAIPPILKVAFAGILAVLVLPSAGSATPKPVYITVSLTAAGPSPRTAKLTVYSPWQTLLFVNNDSVTHTVAFTNCVFEVAPGDSYGVQGVEGHYCRSLNGVGTHRYSVDGTLPGKLVVVAQFRSVSLTGRTHTIVAGGRLVLQGRVSYANGGAPYCAFTNLIRVYARHSRNQLYKRIAMFTVKPPRKNMPAVDDRCIFPFQLTVRPEVGAMYVARANAELWQWKPATSRPFTGSVRR